MHLIELKNVAKYYRSEDNVSVGMKNISTTFNYNEFVAVTGTSGSGKTTLLNVISGLDGYEEGEVYINGEETSHYTIDDWERYRATHVGFIFQNYNIIDSYTVLQNVMLALEIQDYPIKERKRRALELIEQVGLSSHTNHKAAKLSGGQKQRAVIARALAKDTPIIVADEPTGNLDSKSGDQVLKLLHEISKDKLVVIVTHNYSQIENYATRRIKMHDGIIVEDNVLKKTESNIQKELPESKNMKFTSILRLAYKNIISQPKRFIFILLLQILIVGALTFLYTNQVKLIEETGLTNSAIFPTVPDTRVLVQRRDGNELSDEEITKLSNIKEVQKVYKYGENFFSNRSQLVIYDDLAGYSRPVHEVDAASMLNKRFIKGNLPVAYNEVIVSRSYNYKVGQYVTLKGGNDWHRFDQDSPLDQRFLITGISADENYTLYLSDDYLNNSTKNRFYEDSMLKELIYSNVYYGTFANYTLSDGIVVEFDFYYGYNQEQIEQIIKDNNFYGQASSLYNTGSDILYTNISFNFDDGINNEPISRDYQYKLNITLSDTYQEDGSTKIIFINEYDYSKNLNMIYQDLLQLTYVETIKTTSLSVSGKAAGNRVLNRLDNETYRIFYPANSEEDLRAIYVFLLTLLTILLLGVVGSFLYAILHSVTKNVMASRQKDFAIYRSIGSNKRDLGKLVIIEQVILSLLALFIVLIIFNVLAYFFIEFMLVVSYLTFSDYIILLIIFTVFGALLGIRFNRKVFKQSVVETLSLAREDILWLN